MNNKNGHVEIPEVLIQRLREAGLSTRRFLKVDGKAAVEKDWPGRLYEPEELKPVWHGNYGVAAGDGLVLVDGDKEPLLGWLAAHLLRTFKVRSPGHNAPHYYLKIMDGSVENLTLSWGVDEKGQPVNVGHVQANRKYLVGPNSIHPEGGVYTVIDDGPVATIAAEKLLEVVAPFTKERQDRIHEAADLEKHQTNIEIPILQVVSAAGLKKSGDEYYGAHPVHGSETGRNFHINASKNCWHCFRHGSGGGPLLWLAVEEGLIDCSEAVPGALRGDLFKQVLQKAVERGYIKQSQPGLKKTEDIVRLGECTLKLVGATVILYDKDGKPSWSKAAQYIQGDSAKKELRTKSKLAQDQVDQAVAQLAEIAEAKKNRGSAGQTFAASDGETAARSFLKESTTHRIHPSLDYHAEVGLILCVYLESEEKILGIGRDFTFATDNGAGEVEIQQRTYRIRGDVTFFPVQLNQNRGLARLYLTVQKNPEKAKEAAKKVFCRLLEKHTHYLYHREAVEHHIICCWILGTYMYVMFQVYPILGFTGLRETGKGTNLAFISMCGWKAPPRAVVPTLSNLSRDIHNMRWTITMDEADYTQHGEAFAELNSFLESVTERGVTRNITDKETGLPLRFETQAPVAYASRGAINLEDKAILILMEEPDDVKYGLRRSQLEEDSDFNELIEGCLAFAVTYHKEVREAYDRLTPAPKFYGRDFQIWRPILAIAEIACPDNRQEIMEYAENYALNRRKKTVTAEIEIVLLTEIARNIDEKTEYLLKDLTGIVQGELPWVKTWQPIAAAVRNLACLKTTRREREGVKYAFEPDRVRKRAASRGITLGEALQQKQPGDMKPALLTQENIEKVLNALIEASKVRGSATTHEIALEADLPDEAVAALLKQLEREGKVYSPYPSWWKMA